MSDELQELGDYIKEWRESKGFVTPQFDDGETLLGKLMLVVTEVSEAAEAVRKQDFENYVEELADTFIRLLDICATQRIDIRSAILEKMLANEKRPHLHGKKVIL